MFIKLTAIALTFTSTIAWTRVIRYIKSEPADEGNSVQFRVYSNEIMSEKFMYEALWFKFIQDRKEDEYKQLKETSLKPSAITYDEQNMIIGFKVNLQNFIKEHELKNEGEIRLEWRGVQETATSNALKFKDGEVVDEDDE